MSPSDRIQKFREQTAKFPDSELPHFALGKALYDGAQYSEAYTEFSKVAELNPAHMVAHILMARCAMELGKAAMASPFLDEAERLAREQGHESPLQEIAELREQLASRQAGKE